MPCMEHVNGRSQSSSKSKVKPGFWRRLFFLQNNPAWLKNQTAIRILWNQQVHMAGRNYCTVRRFPKWLVLCKYRTKWASLRKRMTRNERIECQICSSEILGTWNCLSHRRPKHAMHWRCVKSNTRLSSEITLVRYNMKFNMSMHERSQPAA